MVNSSGSGLGNVQDLLYDSFKQRAFMASFSKAPASGEYALMFLWNPSDSDVVTILKQVHYIVSNGSVRFGIHNTKSGTSRIYLGNKCSDGAAPQCEIYDDSQAATTNPNLQLLGYTNINTGTVFYPLLLGDYVILKPGSSFILSGYTANLTIRLIFEWVEVAI